MTDTDEPERNMPSRLAHALFTNGLTILTIRNPIDLDGRVAYAGTKGVLGADQLVPATIGLPLGGSLDVGFWKLPRFASTSVVTFFAGITLTMHDFWTVDDDARDEELMSSLQNLTLFDAALAFFKRASDEQQPGRSRSVSSLRIHGTLVDAVRSEPEYVQIP